MSLKIKFAIEKTDLQFQEDTPCEVTITNQAQGPLEVAPPYNAYRMPVLRVTNVDTGAEKIFQRPPDMFTQEMPIPLAPGKSSTGKFNLYEIFKTDKPGLFDVQCEWDWNGGAGRSVSDPVRLEIREVRPRGLHIASSAGGPAASQTAVWVNLAAQPSTLCLSYMDLGRKPRVGKTRNLGPIASGALPIASVPTNGQSAPENWLAWFNGDRLEIARTSENEEGPPAVTNQLVLGPLPKAIVAPLNYTLGPRGQEGKFFLWQGNNEGTISRFQTVHLDAKGNAEAGANAILAGSRPVWTQAVFLSDNSARTYALTQDSGKVVLQGAVWSAKNEAEKTKVLASFPGDFVAGSATLASDDTTYGAVLMLEPGGENSRRLLLHSWRHDPAAKFDEGHPYDVKRQPSEKVTRAVVGAGISGEPVALLRFNDGFWETFRYMDGRKLALDPKLIADAPINIVFPNSTDPLIQYCDPAKGFYFWTFKGGPAGPPPGR